MNVRIYLRGEEKSQMDVQVYSLLKKPTNIWPNEYICQ